MDTATPSTARKFFEALARFARKAIKFVFKTIIAATLAAIILAIAMPVVFFAWRTGQPMEAPQFNGLTFYQYMTWRIETYNEVAAQYQAAHPDVKVQAWGCNIVGNSTFVIFAPMSEFYTLAGKFPALRRFINPLDYRYIPTDVTWATLPSAWWTTYEAMISSTIRSDSHLIGYCQLPQYPPTPEQLGTQKP